MNEENAQTQDLTACSDATRVMANSAADAVVTIEQKTGKKLTGLELRRHARSFCNAISDERGIR